MSKVRQQQLRATTAYWNNHKDFVPNAGEIVVYMDSNTNPLQFKIGDGVTSIEKLSFFVGQQGEQGETGPQGPKGNDGVAATISGATATVDNSVGTPKVTVTSSGTDQNKSFTFNFTGLKGNPGEKGKDGTGVAIKADKSSCTAIGDAYIDKSTGHLFTLTTLPSTFTDCGEIRGPKGDKGDKGDSGSDGKDGSTGATGDGISKIEKTSTSGLTDTYTITFTSGKTTTFTVTNGSDATVQWTEF